VDVRIRTKGGRGWLDWEGLGREERKGHLAGRVRLPSFPLLSAVGKAIYVRLKLRTSGFFGPADVERNVS